MPEDALMHPAVVSRIETKSLQLIKYPKRIEIIAKNIFVNSKYIDHY